MIFVTGASGNIGGAVVNVLSSQNVAFRTAVRDPVDAITSDNNGHAHFDFLDNSTFAAAIEGCDSVLLVRPPGIANMRATLNTFIDVARQRGVEHFVFISVAGAGSNPFVPHHAVERHLQNGGDDWTILRPGFFSQNLGEAYRDDIRLDHRIYLPAGRGRVAFVDTRDIGEVAAKILLEPKLHKKQIYHLTGATPQTFIEVCEALAEELQMAIQYQPASVFGYITHLLNHGMPLGQALILAALHVGLRFGQAEATSTDLQNVLGRQSIDLKQYIHDYRTTWTSKSDPVSR